MRKIFVQNKRQGRNLQYLPFKFIETQHSIISKGGNKTSKIHCEIRDKALIDQEDQMDINNYVLLPSCVYQSTSNMRKRKASTSEVDVNFNFENMKKIINLIVICH